MMIRRYSLITLVIFTITASSDSIIFIIAIACMTSLHGVCRLSIF